MALEAKEAVMLSPFKTPVRVPVKTGLSAPYALLKFAAVAVIGGALLMVSVRMRSG